MKLKEIMFLVEEDPDGGYSAKAMGDQIFTQAEDLASLKTNIKEAVQCHFEDSSETPEYIRLHIVLEEIFANS
ncbi:MAG: hypothetical protein LW817_06920 [Candidatus Caenarcaniphilales bacterium]|jgi:predicted RNase H-like HicB family nuclease|nr:hypothetical protein [Candidatus Caenarcaniphilales bacterium]